MYLYQYATNHLSRYILFVGIVCGIWACREEPDVPCTESSNPDCPNYDPCLNAPSADAGFVMIDSFSNIQCLDIPGAAYYYADGDTCVEGRIYLRALHENDTYQWIIGKDSSYPQVRSFPFDLPTNFSSDTIEIKLITTQLNAEGCAVKETDTLVRTLFKIDVDLYETAWSLVMGSFRGVDLDNPTDSFTITVPPIFPTFQGINNFPEGCVGEYHDVRNFRHGLILNTISTNCKSFCGVGLIQPDRKTLIIDYFVTEGSQRNQKRWIGTKVE